MGSRHWVLILLTLLAFGRGVWELGQKSLWWDESLSYHRAQGTPLYVLSGQIVLTDNTTDVATVDNHPPLYFALLWGAARLFGRSEFALRYLSLAALVLTVPLLYATGKRLGNARLGLGAAALGAISPMYLWYAQEARMYGLLAFVSLLSFYLFCRAFFDPSSPVTARTQRPWLVAYLLASACVVLTQYLGALLIGFELLVLGVTMFRRAGGRRVILLSIAVILAVVLPVLVYAFFTLPSANSRAGFGFVSLFQLARDLLNSFSLGLSVDVADMHVILIDLLFLALLILGLWRFLRPGVSADEHRAGVLLGGFLVLPALAIYLLSYEQPAYMNSRHLIFVASAFYLLVAWGLAAFRGRWLVVGVLCWLAIGTGITYSTYNYFEDPRYNKDQHREWGAYLDEHVRPGDVVVVDPPHIAELYSYYTDIKVPWVGLPLLGQPQQETVNKLTELLQDHDRVWLALSLTPPWGDQRGFPEQWLNENAFRVDYQQFGSYASSLLVACYLPQWPSVTGMPTDAHPLAVRYGPALRLEGYRLASVPESGQPLHVQVYWGIDEQIPFEAGVALRLVDSDGHVWGSGEQCPFNGLYPMWQWKPSLLLQDEFQLDIDAGTPPGLYQLEFVLIERPDGCAGGSGAAIEPAVVANEARRGTGVLLGSVEVQAAAVPASIEDLEIEQKHRVAFDGLRLLGSGLSSANLTTGSRLEVTLYWEARETLSYDAWLRLRMLDEGGRLQQEAIIRPAGANYPAQLWQPGERLQGKFWLPIPADAPAGRYTIELVAEPPLRQVGLWSAVRRGLGSEPVVELGSFDVTSIRAEETASASTVVPTPANLAITHPLAASLGGQVRFLGYDLDSDSVRAGEELSFTLYWQALREIDVSYTAFTHLVDDAGEIWGQEDSVPLDGKRPTTEWQPGEVIADPYSFIVSPAASPGSYRLEIGLYHQESDTRLSVLDADGQPVPGDQVILSEVVVLPPLTPAP